MRVLVTGHKGFIGTILVPMLIAENHDVVGLDSDLYRNSTFGDPPLEIPEINKDVRDVNLSDLDHRFDGIIALAALSNDMLGNLNPRLTYEINHAATVRLAKMAKQLRVPRFIFSASCSSYGAAGDQILNETAEFNPVTPYAISKVMVEHDVSQLADDKFSPTFLRNATAYGVSPRIRFDLVLNNLVAWAYTTGHVYMKSDGSPWRPIVHAEDIARAFIAVLHSPREKIHNEAFNVGRSSENYQIRDLAEIVHEIVPDCRIEFAKGGGPDKRSYRVDFSKYEATFPDYKLQWDARSGAESIYAAYRKYDLRKGQYEGPRFKRIAQIEYLLSTGQVDENMRWKEWAGPMLGELR